MNKLFYPKLAASNIKKNGKFYFPYILTSIFSILMFYNMCFIAYSDGLGKLKGADALISMMNFGTYVIGLFCCIFLYYTNSFLMKRRKKEMGLYNILGMEKKHIAKVILLEVIDTFVISIVCGLFLGILFSKLLMLILVKMLSFDIVVKFTISSKALLATVILFAAIYLMIMISNIISVFRAKPIELLHAGNAGEKEPKTKWIMAIIGFVTLGIGYAIAITTESPLEALTLFFVAVILVIIGTYCLFTAGSIAILKLLKKNKRFYYQTKHFTSVSGMIYRMKQNAVGLANICILSTMVLVAISTTVCLYIGSVDAAKATCPFDIEVDYEADAIWDTADFSSIEDKITKTAEKHNCKTGKFTDISMMQMMGNRKGDKFVFTNTYDQKSMSIVCIMTAQEYKKLSGKEISINSDEIYYMNEKDEDRNLKEISIGDIKFNIKKRLTKIKYISSDGVVETPVFIVSDTNVLNNIYDYQKEIKKNGITFYEYSLGVNLSGKKEDKIKVCEELKEKIYNKEVKISAVIKGQNKKVKFSNTTLSCQDVEIDEWVAMNGSFLFLGIFLGSLFLMATVLIIYYKQILEGYDDKERFQIMQKVGMSKREVKKSIHSQVLMVFIIPIVMAGIHIAVAFKMISKLLLLFGLTNKMLFVICILSTIAVFIVMYVIIYMLTSKVYYKIVENK